MGTTLLRAGKVVDGTGNRAFDGHVLVEGDCIKAVLKEKEALPPADTVIDATGCVIAPGFIDVHSHLDWLLPLYDHPQLLKRLLEQGITTMVGGNCGCSPAPVTAESVGLMDICLACISKPFDYDWRSMGQFLDRIEEIRPIVNLAQLVGHSTVRIAAATTRRGAMRPDEMKNCLDTVERSLNEGACGLSFGLGYDPGRYSPNEEIEAFSAVAAKAKKPVAVHLKSYIKLSADYSPPFFKPHKLPSYFRPHNLRALEEMIDVARHTKTVLQISHLDLVSPKTWPMAEECLKMVEDAHSKGIDIMIDAFPYTYNNCTTVALLPPWFTAKLPEAYKSWWARTLFRAEYAIGFRLMGYSYKYLQVMDTAVEGWESLSGLTIDEVAREWKMSPSEALLKLSESTRGAALLLYHGLSGEPGNEQALESVLSHELCLFETDVLIRSKGYPNPAGLGAFPKTLGYYVRERNLFSIENAIKRMTSASADRFGLKDRGRLAPGKAADIVIFDPRTIAETPPVGTKPAGKPVGIHHVFLNGRHVVKDGSYVDGARAGRVLRR